ncbi:DNA sulfur modification protein DndB [Pelagibacterium sp. H642]|uniref:DNA sulfur modification protein DndB n=1 Tax=Pelagibacterium sp. H642 TaxID=1881069 RepID=UPI002815773B|nr:DNA sulfur modification protein DndB [Pelagibacterium sp. H642]WMT89185.1 DNA sulfur modification protein DndB [Pelagibacterium sp. H642]
MSDDIKSRLNPTKGHMLPGVKIDDRMSLCALPANQLFQLTLDPRDAEDKKKLAASKPLQVLAELREDVQRLFEGQKRKNVPSYAEYICGLHRGADGMTPPIILYSEEPLAQEYDDSGLGYLQVPWGRMLIAIDGETQLAARFEASNIDPETSETNVPVFVVHGFSKNWARQSFHDLNVLGVKPNTALGIGMDARDPLTRVAREVEAQVPFLKDRVNKSRRQLRTSDTDIMTITALRGACITLAYGISGVKYGSKPAMVSDSELPKIREIAKEWFTALTEAFGPAMEDRENKLASASTVLSALGAMGHSLINVGNSAERAVKIAELIASLQDVDWRRGKHWEGIAGKFTPRGVFSVGGSKETSYAVYDALADKQSPAYSQVRKSTSGVAAE